MTFKIVLNPIPLFVFCITLSSCRPHIQETDTISERGPDSLYAAYLVMARSLPDSLRNIGPVLVTEFDSAANTFLVADSTLLSIGKLIDSSSVFALSCTNISDTDAILTLYRQSDDKWVLEGRLNIPFYVLRAAAIHADSDRKSKEIVLYGPPNMNGNYENRFFKYDQTRHILKYSGDVFCSEGDPYGEIGGYALYPDSNILREHYMGSWYMGQYKGLYIWHQDSLVLLRESSIQIIDVANAHMGEGNKYQLEYMENKDTSCSGGLTTVLSERDRDASAHHKKYWDHFFDLK